MNVPLKSKSEDSSSGRKSRQYIECFGDFSLSVLILHSLFSNTYIMVSKYALDILCLVRYPRYRTKKGRNGKNDAFHMSQYNKGTKTDDVYNFRSTLCRFCEVSVPRYNGDLTIAWHANLQIKCGGVDFQTDYWNSFILWLHNFDLRLANQWVNYITWGSTLFPEHLFLPIAHLHMKHTDWNVSKVRVVVERIQKKEPEQTNLCPDCRLYCSCPKHVLQNEQYNIQSIAVFTHQLPDHAAGQLICPLKLAINGKRLPW